jgi:hypothetical protein
MGREVLDWLDPEEVYGVYWYNRRRHQHEKRKNPKTGRWGETAKRSDKERAEWVAIPTPSAGISRETSLRARDRLQGRTAPSRAEGREWELRGGIARCG